MTECSIYLRHLLLTVSTEKAVREFQASADIGIDGVVGPTTWETLDTVLLEKELPITKKVVAFEGLAKWLKFAIKEKSVTEIKGKKHNPRIIQYHSTTTLRARAKIISTF